MKKQLPLLLGTLVSFTLLAQESAETEALNLRQQWHHIQEREAGINGVGTEEALELLEGRESQEIIVAIMDSGIDTSHADLKSQLWVNEGEIPGNGIDDDGNGYVDDIHGWNFLGGPDGNVDGETLELTRMYRAYKAKWGSLDADSIKEANPEEWAFYQSMVKNYVSQSIIQNQEKKAIESLIVSISKHRDLVIVSIGEDYSSDELDSLASSDSKAAKSARTLQSFTENVMPYDLLLEYREEIQASTDYNLNMNLFVRDSIVGDNPDDFKDTIYGNNDLMGGSPGHGTHVAGIVGAIRDNGLGIDGIAPNVKIMVIRAVPDGDEYDKDVALGIMYAVRNGARVINMSFGKDYSPHAEKVQEAANFARDHDVIIVHAAGNDGNDLDEGENYPYMPFESNNLENPAWIEVGASTINEDVLAAEFSNYGQRSVDVFAPGDEIYATLPPNKYGFRSGTSMAAPVVTGVVALIRSYFPVLSAAQVKDILMRSTYVPDDEDFNELSISGGVIDAAAAVKLAIEETERNVEIEESEQ